MSASLVGNDNPRAGGQYRLNFGLPFTEQKANPHKLKKWVIPDTKGYTSRTRTALFIQQLTPSRILTSLKFKNLHHKTTVVATRTKSIKESSTNLTKILKRTVCHDVSLHLTLDPTTEDGRGVTRPRRNVAKRVGALKMGSCFQLPIRDCNLEVQEGNKTLRPRPLASISWVRLVVSFFKHEPLFRRANPNNQAVITKSAIPEHILLQQSFNLRVLINSARSNQIQKRMLSLVHFSGI